MRMLVYTAIVGSECEDPLQEPAPEAIDPRVDYVCFTDQPFTSDVWDIRPIPPKYKSRNHRLTSRKVKILGGELWNHYECSLWLDADYQLRMNPVAIAAHWLYRFDLMALKHPAHNTIEDEADSIVRYQMVGEELVQNQIKQYREHWKTQSRITTTGLMLRRHSERVWTWSKLWWRELESCGHERDQMSVDYTIWRSGIDAGYLEGHYRNNPYARWTNFKRLHPKAKA